MGLYFKWLLSKEYSKVTVDLYSRYKRCSMWVNVVWLFLWNQSQIKVAFPPKSNVANRWVYGSCLQEYWWEIIYKNMDNSKIHLSTKSSFQPEWCLIKAASLELPEWFSGSSTDQRVSSLLSSYSLYNLMGEGCVMTLVNFGHFLRLLSFFALKPVSLIPWVLMSFPPGWNFSTLNFLTLQEEWNWMFSLEEIATQTSTLSLGSYILSATFPQILSRKIQMPDYFPPLKPVY